MKRVPTNPKISRSPMDSTFVHPSLIDSLPIVIHWPGFNRARTFDPITGFLRRFKKPSGVLSTTAQVLYVACAAVVPVARNNATIPAMNVLVLILLSHFLDRRG